MTFFIPSEESTEEAARVVSSVLDFLRNLRHPHRWRVVSSPQGPPGDTREGIWLSFGVPVMTPTFVCLYPNPSSPISFFPCSSGSACIKALDDLIPALPSFCRLSADEIQTLIHEGALPEQDYRPQDSIPEDYYAR